LIGLLAKRIFKIRIEMLSGSWCADVIGLGAFYFYQDLGVREARIGIRMDLGMAW